MKVCTSVAVFLLLNALSVHVLGKKGKGGKGGKVKKDEPIDHFGLASQLGGMQEMMFKAVDTDNDGIWTLEEFKKMPMDSFNQNENTPEESFAHFDQNKDGKVTKKEAEDLLHKMLSGISKMGEKPAPKSE